MAVYEFEEGFSIEIAESTFSRSIKDTLANKLVDHSIFPPIRLFCYGRGEDMPVTDASLTKGSYKGVPWSASYELKSDGSLSAIHFCARYFQSFLAMRLVLLPLIRQCMIAAGGFSILGTAFHYRNKTFHLFGSPGAGKTRLLLDCLDNGAELIGDFELLIGSDGRIQPLMSCLEFRYQTIRSTDYWNRLDLSQKAWLNSCRLISSITGRRISFNLVVDPRELGIEQVVDRAESKNCLVGIGFEDWNAESATNHILNYYQQYESLYTRIFPRPNDYWARLAKNVDRYVETSSFVAVPSDSSFRSLQNSPVV